MFTIPSLLDVAPEVAGLLGCPQAINHELRTAQAGYVCTVCGTPTRLTDTDPAAVLVLAFPDGPHAVRLAHRTCSESAIIAMTDDPDTNPAVLFPAMAWLRPADTDPAPVVIIAPRVYGVRGTANGDTTDTLTVSLLGHGFGLLGHPGAPMPDLDAVSAYLGADGTLTLTLTDAGDEILWSGVLDPPDGWTDAAGTAGRIGVVFAAGLVLDDPDRDRLVEVFTAIKTAAPWPPASNSTPPKRADGTSQRLTTALTHQRRSAPPRTPGEGRSALPHHTDPSNEGNRVFKQPIPSSEVDNYRTTGFGAPLGALPGGCLVLEPPAQPPPRIPMTVLLSPSDSRTRPRGDT